MVVELISVGTEILMGNIVNSNAAYLAEKCAILGVSVYYQTAVGDNESRLFDAIKTAKDRCDVVILTGGLGPTQDDITKEVAAKVCNMPLVEDAHSRKRIERFFENRKVTKVTDNNWKQALVPEGAIVLDNDNGTAPGLILEAADNKKIILLPGPPNELKPMFETSIYPYLNKLQPTIFYSEMVKLDGLGESYVADQISDLINDQSNPTVAPYAKTGEVHLRVTASAETKKEAKRLVKPVVDEIKKRFGIYVYTTDENETLEENVVHLLRKHELTVATCESCTGGLLAGRLVNVPGVSDVFREGFITYSNKSKRKLVDVSKAALKKYGAVSKQVAKEMAQGTAILNDVDIAISVTGIAGPDGGTDEKPVGLVYIGCYIKEKHIVNEYHFTGSRDKIRDNSVVYALAMLRHAIIENYEK